MPTRDSKINYNFQLYRHNKFLEIAYIIAYTFEEPLIQDLNIHILLFNDGLNVYCDHALVYCDHALVFV